MHAIKTVLVTGANRGIGLGIADHLASQEGWRLILTSLSLKTG